MAGTGFGTTDPILVLQEVGLGDDVETGATGIDAGGNATLTGDARVQGEARDIGDLIGRGITSPTLLGIVFNINEPDSDADRNVLLTDLSITIYSAVGEALFVGAYTGADLDLDPINPGTGGAGYLFMLDAAQAAAAEPFWNSGHFLGASASISNAQAGAEDFFAIAIPEPGSVALLGFAGLLMLRRPKA